MVEIGKPTGKVAEAIGVTPATVRNYVKRYGSFLSPTATRPTRKRFNEKDIQTLRLVFSLLHQGLRYDDVTAQLEQQPLEGEILDDLPPPPDDTETDTTQPGFEMQSIEWFNQFAERLTAEHQTAIDAKNETISELKQDKDRMQKELAWLRLPWWRRWTTKPPE